MPKLKPNQFTLSGHLITERPILFQTEMVQANLEDRKTQTRRKLKVRGCKPFYPDTNWDLNEIKRWTKDYHPYGKPGDLLWVRETHMYIGKHLAEYIYKAGYPDNVHPSLENIPSIDCIDWKPSIHMPKSAARLWLMVEDIRVERVQDISEKDAIAEGVSSSFPMRDMKYAAGSNFIFPKPFQEHQMYFLILWCKINGAESWDANLWVWVVQYRILSKTGRPSDETILDNYLQITGKGKEVSNG